MSTLSIVDSQFFVGKNGQLNYVPTLVKTKVSGLSDIWRQVGYQALQRGCIVR